MNQQDGSRINPGLQSIQTALVQLQRELANLKTSASIVASDEIYNIRQRHIQEKVAALNAKFIKSIPQDMNTVHIIVSAMEFIEEHASRYSQLLDITNSGSLKHELVILLIKDLVNLDNETIDNIIQVVIKSSIGAVGVNIKDIRNKPDQYEPPTETHISQQIIVPDRKKDERRQLRKFLSRSKN